MSDVAGQPSQELAEVVGGLRDIHGIVVSEWRRALDGESGGAWLATCEGAAAKGVRCAVDCAI